MPVLYGPVLDFYLMYWHAAAVVGAFFACKVAPFNSALVQDPLLNPLRFRLGPPTIALLGNLHQIPMKDPHFKFREWAQEYEPIVSLKLGSQNVILLNDPSVLRDLLEKRSKLYSARPDLFIREFGDNMNIAFRNNDDVWRRQRKMYHLRSNVKVANQYVPYQMFDSTQLLNDMLDNPGEFSRHRQRYTTSVTSTVIYGWRITSGGQKEIKDLMAKQLREIKKIEDRLFFQLREGAKDNIQKGKVYPSFIRDMLLSEDNDCLNEVEITNNAAHGFGAATDTQWNTTLGFAKAMILYREVQAEAQREIDRVVGPNRLPVREDRENLSYIRAIVEESLRCIAPLPKAHWSVY
ncbi:cytochrome P450 [Lepidopterella palustris CBS 459.81]|uniref:Cytochrome P450 n=1 Tax=Lepidopterella palustris CBS 459.81 TaxID=1314670 RepID=A0A8E2ELU6_9PEZI|nr:cytochrome P450 [Lepidopterella palustris CBS 459.81]